MHVRGMASPTDGVNMSDKLTIDQMLESWIADMDGDGTTSTDGGNAVAQVGTIITKWQDSEDRPAILTLTESDFDSLTYTRNARAYKGMRDGWNAVRDYIANENGLYLCAFSQDDEVVTLLDVERAPIDALEAHKSVYKRARDSHKRAVAALKSLPSDAIASRKSHAQDRVTRAQKALASATADARRLLTFAADSQEEAEA